MNASRPLGRSDIDLMLTIFAEYLHAEPMQSDATHSISSTVMVRPVTSKPTSAALPPKSVYLAQPQLDYSDSKA
eukprot:8779106-Lingulodinium_polyedra.AAC.1